ncbi:MAG: hypothetical protein H6Q04_2362, partial [Acidobacteria bacterium]|nr:hypothetical protein [Acidobacteriota bacterium]
MCKFAAQRIVSLVLFLSLLP